MELTRRANSRTNRAEDARRVRQIFLPAEGHTWDEVSERVIDCSRHLGQFATVLTPELEAPGFWRRPGARRRQPTGARANSEPIMDVSPR